MGWFSKLRKARRLKAFAPKLRQFLLAGWGGSKTYTPAQVRTALDKLKAPVDLRPYCFAAYLDEADYDGLTDPTDHRWPYLEARRSFVGCFRHPSAAYQFESPPDNYDSFILPPSDGF